MALTKLFNTDKEVKRLCYWWSKKVSDAHIVMKRAKKRYQRYKYEDLLKEYNEARRNFRVEVKKAKINAWQEYTSKIDDPWKGLMKILKKQYGNRSQNRTLRDIRGVYSSDMQSTLHMLSKQFYPEVAEYTEEQLGIEESVAERLERTEIGEKITICEFRKAISEMKKAKALGADCNSSSSHLYSLPARSVGLKTSLTRCFLYI